MASEDGEFVQKITGYSPEVLKEQDGRVVPLRLGVDGPVIGEAKLKYVPGTGHLEARFAVNDPKVAEMLQSDPAFSIEKGQGGPTNEHGS